jgi:hypothetical protein
MACALAGCSHSTIATAPPADTPPAATSPSGAVKRFEWAMEQGDVNTITGLVAEDFQLYSAGVDSAGTPTRTGPQDRAWFLAAISAMLDGVPGLYGPGKVSLRLDQNLIAFPDTRSGHSPRVHKQLRTAIDLIVRDASARSSYEVAGSLVVFVTRGDSAAIPPGLLARGVKADSTTWWFSGLEDDTIAGPEPPLPSKGLSFAQLLERYHDHLAP